MKHERFEKRPANVEKQVFADNVEALRAMGKKGARITHEKSKRRREEDSIFSAIGEEKRRREEEDRIVSANEHILTPDGEDPEEVHNATH